MLAHPFPLPQHASSYPPATKLVGPPYGPAPRLTYQPSQHAARLDAAGHSSTVVPATDLRVVRSSPLTAFTELLEAELQLTARATALLTAVLLEKLTAGLGCCPATAEALLSRQGPLETLMFRQVSH